MTLRDFMKDEHMKDIFIDGQFYIKLPLYPYKNWMGIYKGSYQDSHSLLNKLNLIGILSLNNKKTFYKECLYRENNEKYYFDHSLKEIKDLLLQRCKESLEEYLEKQIKDTEIQIPTTPSKKTMKYFLDDEIPQYSSNFEETFKPTDEDLLHFAETGELNILREYLSYHLGEEKQILLKHKTLIKELETLRTKGNPLLLAFKPFLSAMRTGKTVTITYEIKDKTWTGKVKTEEFKDLPGFDTGAYYWAIPDQCARADFSDIFDASVLFACGVKEIFYKKTKIYKRDESLFIFCPDSESLSEIIKEKINRPLDKGLIDILRKKHKKEFYYLGFQGVCLLKSEWE